MDIQIPENELVFEFFRSSGPGGQNVNKLSTAVRLRFDARNSRVLPPEVLARLLRLAGRRVTTDGQILIEAQRFRRQERNRQDALERLQRLIQSAWPAPSPRRPTRRSQSFQRARLAAKKRRAALKSQRSGITHGDD